MTSVSTLIYMLCGTVWLLPMPEALEKSWRSRQAMRTARLQYRIRIVRSGKAIVRNYECLISDDSFMSVNYGDDDGIFGSLPDGSPGIGFPGACSAWAYLYDARSGEGWTHALNSNGANVNAKVPDMDIRGVGMQSCGLMQSADSMYANDKELFDKGANLKVKSRGDTVQISVERSYPNNPADYQDMTYHYTIDKSKGYALTQLLTTCKRNARSNEKIETCETQYRFIDGHWFPAHSRGWNLQPDGRVIEMQYDLIDASFDKPDHPKVIDVQMLNMPAGARVRGEGANTLAQTQAWDGSNLIPYEKWQELKKATGNRELEDRRAANQKADNYQYPAWWYDDTGKMGINDLETNPDSWEAYVRRWCLKNSADEKQRTAAKAILEDSRKEARTILAKRAPELDKIEKQLKDGKLDAKKADEARAEGKRLLAPIAEIFNRLKSRLEPLLLQKQISAKQPTSAPARTP